MPTKAERLRVYIDKVHLRGFKSIDDLDINLQRGLNILIGQNGSGKSNFLEFLSKALSRRKDKKLSYSFAEFRFSSDDHNVFELEIQKSSKSTLKADEADFEMEFDYIEKFTVNQKVFFDTNSERKKGKFEFDGTEFPYTNNFRLALNRFGYSFTYPSYIEFNLPSNLDIVNLPGTIKVDVEQGIIDDGYPYSFTFINHLMIDLEMFFDKKTNEWGDINNQHILNVLGIPDDITDNLRRYSPIKDLRFSPNINSYNDGNVLIIENIKIEFQINNIWLPWSYLSDGTRRLFYIICQITSSKGIVLIEEPELGVHPHQFHLLMTFLKEQSEDKQIIISTHSPKALDHLKTEELNNLLITYFDTKLGTQIRHLTDAEMDKAKRYKEEVGFMSDYWLMSDLEG